LKLLFIPAHFFEIFLKQEVLKRVQLIFYFISTFPFSYFPQKVTLVRRDARGSLF